MKQVLILIKIKKKRGFQYKKHCIMYKYIDSVIIYYFRYNKLKSKGLDININNKFLYMDMYCYKFFSNTITIY